MNTVSRPARHDALRELPSALLAEDKIRSLNPAMADMLHKPAEDCVGRAFADLLPASQRAIADQLLRAATVGRTPSMRVLEFPSSVNATPACLIEALPVSAPAGAERYVQMHEVDVPNDLDSLLIPFRLAAKMDGLSLFLYSQDEDQVEWFGGALPLPELARTAPTPMGEITARVYTDDKPKFQRLTRNEDVSSTPTKFRFRTDHDGWHVLVTQARLIRAGSDGPELLILFLRDDTRGELARQDAQISARQITAFSSALMSAATERELQQVILTRVAATFGGTGCVVAFTENDRLRVSSDGGTDPRLTQHLNGMPLDAANPLPYAIRTGEAQFIPSREEFVRLWPEAGHLLPLTSDAALSVIPFGSVGGQQIGAWAVSYGSEHHASPNEQTLIKTLAGLAGQALRRVRCQQARIELAMIVQQTMLPTVPTDLPGLEIAARYQPSRDGLDIGGDWYDAFMSPDGTVVLEIGDVQGHDVYAAAFMGQMRASLRAFASDEPKPDTVLTRTNDLLVTMEAARFVSCTVLRFDPRVGRVSGASAGHVPLVWARTDGSYGTRELPGGPVLGVLEGAGYGQEDFDLGMDTALVLVTDGVVEGPGTPMESGLNRAGALAAQALVEGLGTQQTADRVLGAGAEVGYLDDRAVLVIRRTEKNDAPDG